MKSIIFFLMMIWQGIAMAQFSPGELSPALWLDASDEAQLTLSGTNVVTWLDKSGNNNHASAPAVANRPQFISSTEGIAFDGVDDLLLSSDISYGPSGGITIFAVAKADSYSGDAVNKKWIVSKGPLTGGAPYGLMQNYNGLHAVVSGNTIVMRYDDQKKHVLCMKYDGSNLSSKTDGFDFPEKAASPKTNTKKVGIGSNDGGSKYPFYGKICEVLIFQRTLDDCEISKINGYLANKWPEVQLNPKHSFSISTTDICQANRSFHVDENSNNGTIVGTLEVESVSPAPPVAANWEINDQLFEGLFDIDPQTGEITIADNTNLNYEKASSHTISVTADTNDGLLEADISIFVNDLPDGDAPKQTSILWGNNGESWDSRGRLPDFSFAGYNSGESVIPEYTNQVSVINYGAVPNDEISDVAAIQQAVNLAPDNSTIFIPAGKYVIDAPITITRNNIVIKGVSDGPDGTVLYLPKSATEYYGSYDDQYSTGDEGFFVAFDGGWSKTICTIVENVKRGDRTITVDDASKLSVGKIICITGNGDNPTNGALWHELHNNQAEDWTCALNWADGNGGPMYHTIERIEGNLVTFREPLRINMNASWNMVVQQAMPGLSHVGIENVRVDFIPSIQATHLEEPGYNGIQFKNCFNFWAKNITINNCDNGVLVKRSSYGEVSDVEFIGRSGHHGFTYAYASNNIARNFRFNNNGAFIHTVTFTHKANGNVLYDVSGTQMISLDFHRNAPFSNLICEVNSAWNHASTGTYCAGPHAGARNVYWNLYGNAGEIRHGNEVWGQYQNTLVSNLSIGEILTPQREWYENVSNVQPSNLYLSQLNKRLSTPAEPVFSNDQTIGDRSNWFERDPARWRVEEIDGEIYYSLFFNEFAALSGEKPGEYALYNTSYSGDFEISTNVIARENLTSNSNADIILIGCYEDDDNYVFGRISPEVQESGIYRVTNGSVTKIQSAAAGLTDNLMHTLSLKRDGNWFVLSLDDEEIAKTEELIEVQDIKVGVGSTDDAVLFNDISLSNVGTSVELPKELQKSLVYPNPTNGVINIKMINERQTSTLYTSTGRIVRTAIKRSVDISDLPSGIYFLEINTGKGKHVEKVVRE